MRRDLVARGAIVVGLALGGVVLVGTGRAPVGVVVAEAWAQPSAAAPSCTLRGTTPMPKGGELWDAAAGGKLLARFTGAPLAATVSDWPADGTGRARVATSVGQGLRIEGFAAAASLPTYTVRDVAVVPSHVWITAGQKVRVVAASAGSLTVDRAVSGSAGQTVRGVAPCEAIGLAPAGRRAVDVPGSGRGYAMKDATLELFAEPAGAAVFTLRMTEGSGELFWGTETRGGFVRVASRGDLATEAWARLRDLSALKKGELMDQAIAPQTVVDGATLALDPPPPIVRATRDVPVRAHRDEKERPIGVLEAGAEVYVMDTIAAFTSVLPKGLGLMPAEDVAFWIPTSEVPK